ncbi:acyl-coenzyme A thioesterase 9, mitochondrial [Hydra vulgaris]|uniref:Acyl-coenzyme A thioesterase 9,mitochondrial n=1 Tax=Hydra vulgaris TaxID=6087 RepID=T2M353_HYDVU|nr:acyl-coenzyme A thioesterase 9, mitochondrial [Hydra vulgaris]
MLPTRFLVCSKKIKSLYISNFYKLTIKKRYVNTEYVDITKNNNVIVGGKNLRNLLETHVGAQKYWLEHKEDLKQINYIKTKCQNELVKRSLTDSVQEVILPIGTNADERETYLNYFGAIRFGKLLEDLDTIAVWVGYKYYKGPTERPPFALVTASVDKINLKGNLVQPKEDLKLKGFVSWAGKTSLEVTIYIYQYKKELDIWKHLAEAVFVMAARSMDDGTSALINPFEANTEEEKKYFNKGLLNKELRKIKSESSLLKISPTADEKDSAHKLFLKTISSSKSTFVSRVKPDNAVWMHDTTLKNLIICHPQSRNWYNKIFGGFLMRVAYELAWANTSVFIKTIPNLITVDNIAFQKPVEVGSLLYLTSQIVMTKGVYLQVRVHAEVVDPKSGYTDTTNVFHFHFTSNEPFPEVIPSTYAEYMLYLDGLRHFPANLKHDSSLSK